MTETEWHTGFGNKDVTSMLTYLGAKLSRRKQVLLACGSFHLYYAQKIKHPDPEIKRYEMMAGEQIPGVPFYNWELAVREVAELFVDVKATQEDVTRVRAQVEQDLADDPYPDDILHNTLTETGEQALNLLRLACGEFNSLLDIPKSKWGDMISFSPFPKFEYWVREADLVRDVVGNPFRPAPVVVPDWLSWKDGTVEKLARGIYEERAFDRLPILADALEDAGCHDELIQTHCRGSEPHIRGCWVIDRLLGWE